MRLPVTGIVLAAALFPASARAGFSLNATWTATIGGVKWSLARTVPGRCSARSANASLASDTSFSQH